MKVASIGRFLPHLLSVVTFTALRQAAAQTRVLELDPAHTEITFTLDATWHTVHGTLQLKTGIIRFNPRTGAASGLVVVDSTSAETGNRTRDRKMHREVLESGRYPEITFTPMRVDGHLAPDGESDVELRGMMKLHGSEHETVAAAQVRIAGEHAEVEAHLRIPYVQWGLENPSTFLLRVRDQIQMDVRGAGHLTGLSDSP